MNNTLPGAGIPSPVWLFVNISYLDILEHHVQERLFHAIRQSKTGWYRAGDFLIIPITVSHDLDVRQHEVRVDSRAIYAIIKYQVIIFIAHMTGNHAVNQAVFTARRYYTIETHSPDTPESCHRRLGGLHLGTDTSHTVMDHIGSHTTENRVTHANR